MKNTPAFPLHNHGTQTLGMHITGMTLRDYFAAKAMQSMNSRPDYEDACAMIIAEDAYALANAMMKAREA
jgi:hypothetical protein